MRCGSNGKLRLLAAVLACFALVMSLGALSVSASGEEWFTAAGDTLLKLSDDTMPFTKDGKHYVPYTIFSEKSLGISYSRNVTSYTLTLYTDFASLTFDSPRGYAYDSQNRYDEKLVGKNGVVFIPAEFVCDYFGLDFQIIDANPLSILRIAGSGALSSSDFKSKVSSSLAQKYLEYQMGAQSASPSPTPSVSAPPSEPGASSEPTPTPTPAPEPVRVYITFDDGPNKYSDIILDALDDYNMRAAFFLTGSLIEMPDRQDTVRRIAGSGHSVGVHSYSHVPDEMYASVSALADELERSNTALQKVTGSRTRLFRFPYGSTYKTLTGAMRDAVIAAGYRYWDWTIDAEDYAQPSAAALAAHVIDGLAAAKPGSDAVILMHDTGKTAEALPTILEYIADGNFRVELLKITDDPINFYKDTR